MLKFSTFIKETNKVHEAINAPILKTSKKHDAKHVKQAIGIASDPRYAKGNMTGAVKAMNKISPGLHNHPKVAAVLRRQNESSVNEISKKLARSYLDKAIPDMFHKGKAQGDDDAKGKLGAPTIPYKKSPERKAAKRMDGIKKAIAKGQGTYKTYEAMTPDEKTAHQKQIDAFKAKGGKITKLPTGYADGWHGKSDPATGMKGMMDKGDTRGLGTKKKVGSMK